MITMISDEIKAKIVFYRENNVSWDNIRKRIFDETGEDLTYDQIRNTYRRIRDAGKIEEYLKAYDSTPKSLHQNIYEFLKSKQREVSIIEIANHFSLPPNVVQENLDKLTGSGYDIRVKKADDDNDLISLSRFANPSNKIVEVRSKEEVIRFGLISDTHLVSKYADLDTLYLLYKIFEEEGIEQVYHVGNIADGEKTYRGQEYEILTVGADNQADYVAQHYPYVEEITTYFIASSTCHEGGYYKRDGLIFGRLVEQRRDDLIYLGMDEVDVKIENGRGSITLRLMHPGGKSAYATSYRSQKIMESIVDALLSEYNNIEYWNGRTIKKEIPNILAIGHFHKNNVQELYGCYTIQAGCVEYQTPFMKKRSISAHIGGYIVEVRVIDHDVVSRVKVEWIPGGRAKDFFLK